MLLQSRTLAKAPSSLPLRNVATVLHRFRPISSPCKCNKDTSSSNGPSSDPEPAWVRRERERKVQEETKTNDLPWGLYLLFSSFVAIAAVGCIFEYVAGNAFFGVIEKDSPVWAPLLITLSVTGFPTSAFLFYKGVDGFNQEADRQNKIDGMYISSLNAYHSHDTRDSTHKVHDARAFSPPPESPDDPKGGPMILLAATRMTLHSGSSLHQGGSTGNKVSVKVGGVSFRFRPTPLLIVQGPMRADELLGLISQSCAREAGRNILLKRIVESISHPGSKIDLGSIKIDKTLHDQVSGLIQKATEGGEGRLFSPRLEILSFDPDPLDLVSDEELWAAAAAASEEGLDSIMDHLVETNEVGHYEIVWC